MDAFTLVMGETQRVELFDATFKAAVHLMQVENGNAFYKLTSIVN